MLDSIKEKVENRIIDLIALGSAGRLIVFKPQNSPGHEVDKDLVIEKKGDYKKLPISLKIYEKELFEEVLANKNKNLYLIFVHFDPVKQDIEDEFFIVLPDNSKKITIDKKDFGKFLIEKLENKN